MTRGRALLAALAVLALAFALRWRHAAERESLWGDEAQNIGIVHASTSLADVWRRVQREGHPPLHYWVEWTVHRAFGESVPTLRAMVVVLSTLQVALLVALGAWWFGARCGLLAGLLAATSPYLLHTTTEIRSYALFGVLALVHAAAYVAFLRRPGIARAVAWGVAAAAMVYTHYYGLHIALAGGLYALARDRSRRTVLHVGLAGLVGAVLFAPWLPHFFWQMRPELQGWYEPRARWNGLLAVVALPLGRWGALIILWALVRGFLRARRTGGDDALAFRGLFWIGAGAALLAFAAHQLRAGNYLPRYLVGMVLPLLLPVCFHWSRTGTDGPESLWGPITGRHFELGERRLRRVAALMVVLALVAQRTDPARWLRQPSAAARLAERVARDERPGDLVLVSPAWFAQSFGFHYGGALPILAPPYASPLPPYIDHVDLFTRVHDEAVADRFARRLATHLEGGGRVWFVALSTFPVDSRVLFPPRPPREKAAPLLTAQHALHVRLARLLYQKARPVAWLEGTPKRYLVPLTLGLFDPN